MRTRSRRAWEAASSRCRSAPWCALPRGQPQVGFFWWHAACDASVAAVGHYDVRLQLSLLASHAFACGVSSGGLKRELSRLGLTKSSACSLVALSAKEDCRHTVAWWRVPCKSLKLSAVQLLPSSLKCKWLMVSADGHRSAGGHQQPSGTGEPCQRHSAGRPAGGRGDGGGGAVTPAKPPG